MPQPFKTRRVGQTSLEVTELGLGTATFGGMMGTIVSDEQGRATVTAAVDAGIRFVDTAPHYGFGRSEHVTGDALRFRPEQIVLSTKVGRMLRPVRTEAERSTPSPWTQPFPFELAYDYSRDAILRSFEDSLQRLGLGKIDVLLVHDIGVQTHGEDGNKHHWGALSGGGYAALNELKAQGLVSAIGLGVNEWPVLMDAMELGDWDVFLLANRYTLLEQGTLSPFLETCVARKTSVIAAGPFAGGALAGTNVWGPPDGRYDRIPSGCRERIDALTAVCREHNVPLGAAALQFPLAHKAICNVLTGPRSPAELTEILAWWNTEIPAGFWDALADKGLVAKGTPLPNGRTA